MAILASRIDTLSSGQSWGGMLGAETCGGQPQGLKALVIANSPANMHPGSRKPIVCAAIFRSTYRKFLLAHEEAGTLTHPRYIAPLAFYTTAMSAGCHTWPEDVARTFAAMDEDNTVYRSMNGPTEFTSSAR